MTSNLLDKNRNLSNSLPKLFEEVFIRSNLYLKQLWNLCVTNDHGYAPLVLNTSQSLPHSRLITTFVTRLTRRMPLVEHELLTLPERLSSSLVFSGVRVTRSLVLYVCFVDRCLSFCTFSFGHCVFCWSQFEGTIWPSFSLMGSYLYIPMNY